LSRTQKLRNQRTEFAWQKYRRKRCCRGGERGRDPCHHCMSESLDWEEYSRPPTPTTGIVDNLTSSSVGVGSTRWDVEHRDSTQGQCLSWTQKPQNQRGRFHLTKVGRKEALSGWRETLERERGEGTSVPPLYGSVPRSRGTFEVTYASNWHHQQVRWA
jgi:hypothetical protein